MDTTIKHVIAYLRVSTEEQAVEGISLAAQRKKIRAWAELNAPEAEVHLFEDRGITGTKLSCRPGLLEAIEQSAKLKNAALVVYSLSRLSRSTRDTLWVAEKLDRNGCELVSLSEKIDTTTAAGKMVFRMLAVLAEFERDQISERTKAAMAQLRSEGKRFTRYDPYPDHFAERAAELRDRGMSYRKIAKQLEKEGYKTHLGGPWQPAMVRRLARRAGSQ
jgi:DNA invertase Pin-like site-specific DNA recombinase